MEFTITDISHNLTDGSDIVTVNVTNSGNLTDTGQLTMYVDGTRTGDTRHYELNPGQSKAITFTVPSPEGIGSPWKSLNFILTPLKHFPQPVIAYTPLTITESPTQVPPQRHKRRAFHILYLYYIYYIPRRLHTQATPIMSPY